MKKINLTYLIGYMEVYSNWGKAPFYMLKPETYDVYCADDMDDSKKEECIMIPKVDIYKLQLDFIYGLNSRVITKKAKKAECGEPYLFSTFFHDLTETNAYFEYLGRDIYYEWSELYNNKMYLEAALWCQKNRFPYEIECMPEYESLIRKLVKEVLSKSEK